MSAAPSKARTAASESGLDATGPSYRWLERTGHRAFQILKAVLALALAGGIWLLVSLPHKSTQAETGASESTPVEIPAIGAP